MPVRHSEQFLPRLSGPQAAALRATARLCGLGVVIVGVGCPSVPSEAPASTPTSDSASDATSPTRSGDDSQAPSQAGPKHKTPADPDAELAACRTTTQDAFNEKQEIKPGLDEQAVLACCERIAAHYDEANQEGIQEWQERWECCAANNWAGGQACTPWGPTAPPVAGDERRVLRAARHLDLEERASRVPLAALAPPDEPAMLASATNTWRTRMLNEYVSARVFERVADQMQDAGFGAQDVRRWSQFAAEERRHGALCGRVVQALGGKAMIDQPPLPVVPSHADVDAKQAVLRNVLSISCLSETVAVSLIGAERNEMPPGPLRTLLTEIYADEIGHARAGWALLRRELALDPQRKADLRDYLPIALRDLYAHELEHLPLDARRGRDGRRWGLCDGVQARALFFATVDEVIAPGVAELLA